MVLLNNRERIVTYHNHADIGIADRSMESRIQYVVSYYQIWVDFLALPFKRRFSTIVQNEFRVLLIVCVGKQLLRRYMLKELPHARQI